jgi:hypothetical protein
MLKIILEVLVMASFTWLAFNLVLGDLLVATLMYVFKPNEP